MFSNRTRMVGLSGIDTESLVQQMMKAESVKYDRLLKQNTMLKWQQEKYQSVSSKILNFSNTFMSMTSSLSLRADATFGGFKSTVKAGGSESSKVSVKTTGSAKEGSYSLQVNKLASKSTAISGKLSASGKITLAEADLSNIDAGDTVNVTFDGVSKSIELDGGYTSDSAGAAILATELKDKLNAAYKTNAFGASSGTITTTEGHDLTMYEGKKKNATQAALSGMGGSSFTVADGDNIKYSFLANGTKIVVDLTEGYKDGKGKDISFVVQQINKGIDAAVSEMNKQIKDPATIQSDKDILEGKVKELAGLRAIANGDKIEFNSGNTNNSIEVKSGGGEADLMSYTGFGPGAVFTLERASVLKDAGLTSGTSTLNMLNRTMGELFGITGPQTFTVINGVDGVEIDEKTTLQGFINKVNSSKANVTLTYESMTGKFKLASNYEGRVNGFKTDLNDDFTGSDLFSVFSANVGDADDDSGDPMTGLGWNVKEAHDAEFVFNGVPTTRATNSFTHEGLQITLNGETVAGETITVDIKKDPAKNIEVVKEFVKAYNELISIINTEVEGKRAKSGKYSYYEPLTDDERKAMSESEVKLWEEKAKQGILRRDSILSGITRSMREALYQEVEISEGKLLSLHQIGVTTSDSYWKGGELVIDEEKLAKALDEMGNDVTKLFTVGGVDDRGKKLGIGGKLNLIIQDAIGSNGSITRKAGVESRPLSMLDNDFEKQIKRQQDKISDMLEALIKKEEYYYSMFARMESSVMQSNSQMEYLMAQLGS